MTPAHHHSDSTSEPNRKHPTREINAALSDQLGFDVELVEIQAKLQLDLIALDEGRPAGLGYVLLERAQHPNAAVVFADHQQAVDALSDHPLIDELVAEDCRSLDAPDPARLTLADLAGREIIIPQ